MIKKIILIIGMIALLGNGWAQTAGENFDVTHYEIRLWDFNFSSHTLQGEAFVDITVTAPTDTFVLELKSLTVTDAATESYSVTDFHQEGDFLTIVIDETANAGETITLDVRYGGNTFSETWGGVEWWGSNYVYNLGVGFDSQPHNLGKTWFPCVDNFTDKASYTLYITDDNDKKAICGGNLINTFDNGDGTTTWHWETPQEIATYHISFAIGDYQMWEDTYHGIERDIPVQVFAKPAQMNNVPGTFANVKAIAAFYEENFGPYPFNRIGYVSTGKGCMEHTDNIAMAADIINGNTTQEEYVAHELSHMYFGNKVTCSTAGDMWLNEGFAQFCGQFYRVGVYGEDNFQTGMNNLMKSITNWCNNESNWIPLNNMPLDMTYDSKAIYDRGAVIVNTMMNYMGRENFLNGIRHYLETYSFGDATSEQLRDALTEATGIDMSGFFDTYVFHGGMPHFAAGLGEITQAGDSYDVLVRMTYQHKGPSHVGHDNRVEVTFMSAEGQLQTQLVAWDGLEEGVHVNIDFEPIAAVVDYYNHFLDAKLDQTMMATAPVNFTVEDLQTKVISVSDSTMVHVEGHFVRPEDDPDIPGLTLSTSHYWEVLRHDFGEAEVLGIFKYSNSTSDDGDIIHTQNDSAVLLYRSGITENWHIIPYTQEGSWKLGRFHVDNLQTGQYAIGVLDKTIISANETPEMTPSIFPNPANDQVTIRWNHDTTGTIRVFNQQLQLVKSIPYHNTHELNFNIRDLAPGIYLIENHLSLHKLIVQ